MVIRAAVGCNRSQPSPPLRSSTSRCCSSSSNTRASTRAGASAGQAEPVDSLRPATALSLHGVRVLVTAPRQYAGKLCALLAERGARPIVFPAIEICSLQDERQLHALDERLERLCDFTHLAFTSKNGIQAVLQRLRLLHNGDVAAAVRSAGVKVCALGADAKSLFEAGLHVDVQPQEASTQGLVQEMIRRGEAQAARVLCPVPCVVGGLSEPPVIPKFISALETTGASVTRIDAYLTQPGATPADVEVEKELLRQGHVRAVLFSSQAEAQGLMLALGGLEEGREVLQQSKAVLAAHGPYTAKGVSDITGQQVEVIGKNFSTFAGVVAALEEHCARLSM